MKDRLVAPTCLTDVLSLPVPEYTARILRVLLGLVFVPQLAGNMGSANAQHFCTTHQPGGLNVMLLQCG